MKNKTKFFILIALVVVCLAVTSVAKAAYDDVTVENETVFYISGVAPTSGGTPGINITMGGETQVESIEVASTSMTVSMPAGSKIHLISSDRKNFSNNLTGTNCEYSRSYLVYTATSDQTLTITFSDGDNCPADSGGGGAQSSGSSSGAGSTMSDVTAPSINNTTVVVKDTEVTLTWNTNEPSLSWVTYGTSTTYGEESKSTIYKTSHLVTLSGLTPLTTYHYQVKAKDSSGNISSDSDRELITLAAGEEPVTPTTPTTETPITPTMPASPGSQALCVMPPSDGLSTGVTPDMKLAKKVAGRLLLRVEKKGEIWYVDTKEYKRYQITFGNALCVFQKLSLGINNANLAKIPVDGTKDVGNTTLRNKLKGKLLLAVEDHGRIWYVDKDGYRYEVTWKNLMDLFQKLALGITDANLAKIPEGSL